LTLPRLTVITPSLNQGRYLERTIRSVLDQGYPDLEYIVVDGGSNDESVEILRRYDDRLAYWTSEPDSGQTDAINKGLARATGEVVSYINSDDYYLPGAFDAALPLFADPAVDWVAGACRFLYPDGTVEAIWEPKLPERERTDWILDNWSVPQSASFWRRRVFTDVGAFREDFHYVFDTEFELRLALSGILPTIVNRELSIRYLHDDAKSADRAPFEREADRMTRILWRSLPLRERVVFRARWLEGRVKRYVWLARGGWREERRGGVSPAPREPS
jgi:glycosyltransferase involved in cell wall biosynthesis